ncbi:MAG: hypothetical protein QHC67_05610 [Sphingobium sp.]|nr:hypothetical protein [Sphingobium sp.]
MACDIHLLKNLRVLNAISRHLSADADDVNRWIAEKSAAPAVMISHHGAGFGFGVTLRAPVS